LGRVVGHLERVADLTFDERQQALSLGELRADELAATRAKLAGAAKHLGALLAEVDAARGEEPLPAVEVPPDAPKAPARLTPIALRTEVRGQWLWLYGAPSPNGDPLTRDLYLAGAVWSPRKGAWYAPGEERARRVASVVAVYRAAEAWASGQRGWYASDPKRAQRIGGVVAQYQHQPEAAQEVSA